MRIILFLFLFCNMAYSQTVIVLEKPIWFYKKEGSINGRSIIKEGSELQYYPEPGKEYYKAIFEKKDGFVEAVMVSDDFQKGNIMQSNKKQPEEKNTIALTQDFGGMEARINKAGKLLSEGAGMMIFGSVLSVGSAIAGSLLASDKPKLGATVGAIGGGAGLLITIVGMSSIKKSGKTLQAF